MDSWHLSGKLGYRSADNAGSAWIDWKQQPETFSLNLNGPFGAGATRIEGTQQQASLFRSGKPPISAKTPEELTDLLFGWQWPVEQLLYWVRGLPHPEETVDHRSTDNRGLLLELHQSGWQLQFSRYLQAESGLVLPGKIKGRYMMSSETYSGTDTYSDTDKDKGTNNYLSFTLIIKNWNAGSP